MPNPRVDTYDLASNTKCSYDCSRDAIVKFMNGRFCCEETPNACPSVRVRNSERLKKSYENGDRKPVTFTEDLKKRISDSVKKTKTNNKQLQSWDEMSFQSKRKIVLQEQNYKCIMCESSEWLGQKIKLEVDHIDGNKINNVRTNLRGLCPNCHSFTDTWRKKKSAGSPTAGGNSLRNCTV